MPAPSHNLAFGCCPILDFLKKCRISGEPPSQNSAQQSVESALVFHGQQRPAIDSLAEHHSGFPPARQLAHDCSIYKHFFMMNGYKGHTIVSAGIFDDFARKYAPMASISWRTDGKLGVHILDSSPRRFLNQDEAAEFALSEAQKNGLTSRSNKNSSRAINNMKLCSRSKGNEEWKKLTTGILSAPKLTDLSTAGNPRYESPGAKRVRRDWWFG